MCTTLKLYIKYCKHFIYFHFRLFSKNEAIPLEKVILSFVVCDSRLNESLNVVKSSLLFTRAHVHFVIFTDDNLLPILDITLRKWIMFTDSRLSFELHQINFPENHKDDWINLFSKCAAQRLFIPVSICFYIKYKYDYV